jgi:hypothetical protein
LTTVARWFGFAVGLGVLAATALSVLGTLVVPRGVHSRISRLSDAAVDSTFLFICKRTRNFVRRDRVLAWQAPAELLGRLVLWIVLLVIGFSLVLLPLVPGSPAHAFSEAGSSMFTLGYSAPTNGPTSVVDYIAAFTGLITVAVQIGYLPTLYAAFNRRETEVTLVNARAGTPAWGPELLARIRYGIGDTDAAPVLSQLFTTWERWAADVAESHTTYLTLTRFRSPRPYSHWLTSLLAVMDAAALHLSLNPHSEPRLPARLCLRTGFVALQQISRTMGITVQEDPDPDGPLSLTFEDFAVAVDMLRSLGYPLEASTEQAWPNFRGWRVNYESAAYAVAYAVDAPPALWSGPRRWPAKPIAPKRPVTRLAEAAEPRPQS